MPGEFDLITQYFDQLTPQRDDVLLGIGDDAALCLPPQGQALVIAVDTLIAGVHFPLQTCAEDVGYKALAVNLSDLAAMGAIPAWMTLALTLPGVDEGWLAAFSQGLGALAKQHQVALIGGDTTRGALSVSVQIMGFVPSGQALQRHTAQPGDFIYVTGELGAAGLALKSLNGEVHLSASEQKQALLALNRPVPRLAIGKCLRGIASSAIDISDGLWADLGHILERSQLGAQLQLADLPLSPLLLPHLSPQQAWELALTAGDEYELCFTVPPERIKQLESALAGQSYCCIGQITVEPGLRCLDENQQLWQDGLENKGYQHFF
ncbi:thiamine-phosphate kinase [Candidatus Venteria ishoeyi]|uniref:thiamine-phosphate kinase n=1 Tax=Candidatus Venteria ishoeyi TaxID=1899563 RepID=UPI0025A682D5|nr:thiamine-phosphate kinase [Candidatus Venteria ishoeyi]MDM8545737.1 thiamine-phosphate kinase [Candidatus Venteria ishoeyi]